MDKWELNKAVYSQMYLTMTKQWQKEKDE